MSAESRALLAVLALGAVGAGVTATCAKAPLTAPSGTTVYLQANPDFVPANGGQALVTALLTEPAGTLVADGTEVFFLTTLGTIPDSAKTANGMARVYFVSDARSGTATVVASSGGPAPAPSASATPTPATVADVKSTRAGAIAAWRPVAAGATGTGTGSASITIDIGSALPARVIVTANPQLLASSRSATIVANVFDANGNPVQNVPVIFQISVANPLQEFLASGGTPQFTNTNGQAFDTLTTRAPNGTTQKTVTVTATTPTTTPVTGGGSTPVDGSVDVIVNYTPA